MKREIRILSASVVVCVMLGLPATTMADGDETEVLRGQIEQMQEQLEAMQQRLARMEEERDQERQERDHDRAEREEIEAKLAELEETEGYEGPDIDIGGAVRLNYGYLNYDDQNQDRLGDFELELFRVNFRGEIGDVILDAEWRRYNDFHAIHHAWFGYDFSDRLQMQLGITQVPFGILPWASHSFWFGGTYYLGYEDDYDTGVKFIHQPNDDWTFHYAFFKNPEYSNDARADRYSFDLVTGGDQQNTETNQFNFRAERHITHGEDSSSDVGISLQAGQMYNRATESNGDRWAIAGHYDGNFGPWNLQLQGLRYEYNPENPDGVSDDFVQKGAFAFPFLMPAKANVYSVNFARSFDVNAGPITGVNCYNNFTYIDPQVSNSAESIQNVTGCSVAAGGLFTYFDWINGKNMWFAGGEGIGLDGATAGEWENRININLGYYF